MDEEPPSVAHLMALAAKAKLRPVTILDVIETMPELRNTTEGVDGVIPRLVKCMGLRDIKALLDNVNAHERDWTRQLLKAVHMVRCKKPGDSILEQRTVQVVSGVSRIEVRLLGQRREATLPPAVYGGRQFAGPK